MGKQTMYNEKTVEIAGGKITALKVVWFDAVTRKPIVEFDGAKLTMLQTAQLTAYGMAQNVQDSNAPYDTHAEKLDAMRKRIAAIQNDEYRLGARGAGMADADVFDAAVAVKLFGETPGERDIWRDLSKSERTTIRTLPSVATELARRAKVVVADTKPDSVLAKFKVVKKADAQVPASK